MRQLIPQKQREFAVDAVRQLRERGFAAYWAGGCVRDHLLGRTPKDFDVATSAHPEQIRGVFHKRKTLAMGAAFGVMTVVGPRGAGQIEVATFRQDVSYSDGRHPDQIAFSSPEEDAKRRDFTINGMFFDPLAEQVIDFVGGQADLRQGLVRAIGDATARFTEDKLRMIRAIRFASIFDFRLEESTLSAIRAMSREVTVVSAERIADEMRTILVHPSRIRAARLMYFTGLMVAVIPEVAAIADAEKWSAGAAEATDARESQHANCAFTLSLVAAPHAPTFPLALAAFLFSSENEQAATDVARRWKLSRKESDRLDWLLSHRRALAGARNRLWSQLQPLLIHEGAAELVDLHAALATLKQIDSADVEFCRTQLQRAAHDLDPPPLLTGDDLCAMGISPGPVFARLLQVVRYAQLDGQILDRAAAEALVQKLLRE